MMNFRTAIFPIMLLFVWEHPDSRSGIITNDSIVSAPMEIWTGLPFDNAPSIEKTSQFEIPGLQSLFYEGMTYMGKPTKVYAYYGVPRGTPPPGGWPAVVLVHGGGGTAFPQYVTFWNEQGYAAISMDLEGHMPEPGKKYNERSSFEWSGPSRSGMWEDIDKPVDEQYFYHVIPQVVLAHSLIRSFPEVNAEKTGIIGVSWGGIITCLVSGVDDRFKFGVPVYGCGFLVGSDGHFGIGLGKLSNEQKNRFLKLWEPSLWLADAKLPMLWINGTNDPFFPMVSWQESIRSAQGPCLQRAEIKMPHGSEWGFMNKEAVAFANSILKNGDPLPDIGEVQRTGQTVAARVTSVVPTTKAELCYTLDTGNRTDRQWEKIPASLKHSAITALLPRNTVAYFLSVIDERGIMVTSDYRETGLGNNPTAAFIQRSMKTVRKSQSENPATLRVMFYGQSITGQPWSKAVEKTLKDRFPDVNFVFNNSSIGGFGSDLLVRTAEHDLYTWYPDLLIFHVYGPLDNYEEIIRNVRERTTSEIVLWTDHVSAGGQDRNLPNYNEYRTSQIKAIAAKYQCMLIDVNDKWQHHLRTSGLTAKSLLTDQVHLNEAGCTLMAQFIAGDLIQAAFSEDHDPVSGSISEIPWNSPHFVKNKDGSIQLTFTGNRVLAISDGTGEADAYAEIPLDGNSMNSQPELWAVTRPSPAPHIWMPAIKNISFVKSPVEESWTLTVLQESTPDGTRVHFKVHGSVTGEDGEGWSNAPFTSTSGRVVILPEDWHLAWCLNHRKISLPENFQISWSTYPVFTSVYQPKPARETTLLVQGCDNREHTLTIRPGKGTVGIGSFLVYKPLSTR